MCDPASASNILFENDANTWWLQKNQKPVKCARFCMKIGCSICTKTEKTLRVRARREMEKEKHRLKSFSFSTVSILSQSFLSVEQWQKSPLKKVNCRKWNTHTIILDWVVWSFGLQPLVFMQLSKFFHQKLVHFDVHTQYIYIYSYMYNIFTAVKAKEWNDSI